MCSPAMVLVVHAPVICLVEDLMVACGKRADDTLCLLAPTRRWCCQQPKKKWRITLLLPNKTNTAKARSSCATRKCGAGQFGCQKLRARTRFRTRMAKYTCRVKQRASGLSTSTKRRSFFILLEQKQHLINRYRTHLHKSTVPSKWLTFYFSLQQSLWEESQGWS